MTYENDPRNALARDMIPLIDADVRGEIHLPRTVEVALALDQMRMAVASWCDERDADPFRMMVPREDWLYRSYDALLDAERVAGATWSDGAEAYISTDGIAIRNDQDEERGK